MNTQDQLELFFFMLGIVSGFSAATTIYLWKDIKRNRQLTAKGQKLIDKLVARKQVDFWYNESIRLFLDAAQAETVGNWQNLERFAEQHALAVRRFEQARLNLLELQTPDAM